MKKNILFLGLFLMATVIAVITSAQFNSRTKSWKERILEDNIEALASGEYGNSKIICLGEGSMDCPIDGSKVYFVGSVQE